MSPAKAAKRRKARNNRPFVFGLNSEFPTLFIPHSAKRSDIMRALQDLEGPLFRVSIIQPPKELT